MAREDIWALLQAAAKPELRKVFAAMSTRPCWLDTGASHIHRHAREDIVWCNYFSHLCILLHTHTDERRCFSDAEQTGHSTGWSRWLPLATAACQHSLCTMQACTSPLLRNLENVQVPEPC